MAELPRRTRVWLVAYLVVAAAQVVGELFRIGLLSGLGLVLAMPALAAVLLASGRHRTRMGRWVAIAIGFSWLGDVLGFVILAKIAFFLLAQLSYVAAFWPFRRRIVQHPWVLVVYVLVVAALAASIGRESGSLVPAIIGYGGALGLMAVLATGVNRIAGIGGAIFVVSDSLIGIDAFVSSVSVPQAGALIMVSYLSAQLLLLWGVLQLRPTELGRAGPPVEQPEEAVSG
ncbi:MAG: lysoplasmalogenase [Propionibacteriaceae bacterium]